ncbi:Mis12 protein-domain-containing protein [Crepidotus variabilis]|uniref:Mis12 protein-domain-containing protein n=1 Tax=Crepidotus variabilis TaxID=179855 RepID=A0A9P6JPJ6_9AGAR|nr:Mis12 protein-domain-containing protein [Crepidotus variabilis]
MPEQPAPAPATATSASALLLCEALGFSPQLLLDDIINISNNAVLDGVNGMEEFLQNWADERRARDNADTSTSDVDATTHEVEQGLVAFQTLLEYHTDIAFDFFEAWCLRNIFMIPPDLPIVLPHQEGLDLSEGILEKEQELTEEVEMLRKRLDGQRKLNRSLHRSIRVANNQHALASRRLNKMSSLSSSLGQQASLPPNLQALYESMSSLPALSSISSKFSPTSGQTEPGRRPWESTKSGYMNWALGRLLSRGGNSTPADEEKSSPVDRLDVSTDAIGRVSDLQRAAEEVEKRRSPEEDSQMEE